MANTSEPILEESNTAQNVHTPAERGTEQEHRSFSSAQILTMDEAFKGYRGDHAPQKADWGADTGAELVE